MASAEKHLKDRVGSRLQDPLVVGILHSWAQHVAARVKSTVHPLALVGWFLFILATVALGLTGVGHTPTPVELIAGLLGFAAGWGLGLVVGLAVVVGVVAKALRRQPALR